MRKFLAALTITTTILFNSYLAPAQAQIHPTKTCSSFPSGVTLKVLDDSTIICESKTRDTIYIYRSEENSPDNFSMSLSYLRSDINLITIYEHKTQKLAQFDIEGRKFKRWISPDRENLVVLNKYRKYVTLILDTKEEMDIPDF